MTKRKRPFGQRMNSLDGAEDPNDNEEAEETSAYTSKKSRVSNSYNSSGTYGRVDPNTGQRSAIPGLDDFDENTGEGEREETEYEDEDQETREALKYLRGVRAEALTIPSLLTAPQPPVSLSRTYTDGTGDSRGYYSDGAYTARPRTPPPTFNSFSHPPNASYDPTISSPPNPTTENSTFNREEYTASLLARFFALRTHLSSPPDDNHYQTPQPYTFAPTTADWLSWRWRLANSDPVMGQIAKMDRNTVLRLLRLIGGRGGGLEVAASSIRRSVTRNSAEGSVEKELRGAGGIEPRLSRWLWGLLARLPERGEMGSEEIGVVREVGKKVVLIGVALKGEDTTALDPQNDAGEEDEGEMDVEANMDEEVDLEYGEKDGLDEDNTEENRPQTATSVPPLLESTTIPEDITTTTKDPLEEAKSHLLTRLHTLPPDPVSDLQPDVQQQTEAAEEHEDQQHEQEDQQENQEQEEQEDQEDQERTSPTLLRTNTLATIDTVLTIVGEVYGQRDLLEFVGVWGSGGGEEL